MVVGPNGAIPSSPTTRPETCRIEVNILCNDVLNKMFVLLLSSTPFLTLVHQLKRLGSSTTQAWFAAPQHVV
jgi:hypothetical protein